MTQIADGTDELITGIATVAVGLRQESAPVTVVPRENTARSLSFWLVITFTCSVALFVLVSAFLSIYVVLDKPELLESTLGSLGKWAATISTLLAAPLGFVLGHYFKTDSQRDEEKK